MKQQATRQNNFKSESLRRSKVASIDQLRIGSHSAARELTTQRETDAHLYQALIEQPIGTQTLTEAQLRQGERHGGKLMQ